MYKNWSTPNRNAQNEMQIDTVCIVGGEWEEGLRWKESVQFSVSCKHFTHASVTWRHHAQVFQRKEAKDYSFSPLTRWLWFHIFCHWVELLLFLLFPLEFFFGEAFHVWLLCVCVVCVTLALLNTTFFELFQEGKMSPYWKTWKPSLEKAVQSTCISCQHLRKPDKSRVLTNIRSARGTCNRRWQKGLFSKNIN